MDVDLHERVWRALADPTRRAILDELAHRPHTTGELTDQFARLSRTAVMKHIEVLATAGLLTARRDGRTRWNHLNAAPIQHVCDRWIRAHVKRLAGAMSRLKTFAESKQRKEETMSKTTFETRGATYELELGIDVPRAALWRALTEETNAWWLPDYHMVGAGSVVELKAEAGGHLIERLEDGGSLLWGTVHMVNPGHSMHMVGFSFPEWGGPGMTMLKFAIEDGATRETSLLRLSDALVGRVSDEHVDSLLEGWTVLLRDGLKAYVEGAKRSPS